MNVTRRRFAQLSGLLAAGWAASPAWALSPAKAAAPDGRRTADAIDTLADYCLNTRYEDLPAEVIAVTKSQILDTVAVALPALDADGIRQLYAWSKETGGRQESRVLGTAVRLPAEQAARLNASMAAALEFDDTYEPSLMHASCVTIPVALTVADLAGGIDGKTLIAAVAAGTDAACRLSRAGSPGVSPFVVGWDPTPMYGFLAASLVAARLLGLTREQAVAAAGLAYHQLSGNAQASIDGTHAKRLGAGFASYGGVMSARLAQRGVFGSPHVLDGVKGLFRQYHGGRVSEEALLADLGSHYAGPEIAPKPYPCCRGGHVAIDAALDLVRSHDIRPAAVDHVRIYSPPAEMMLLGAPWRKNSVRGASSRRSSAIRGWWPPPSRTARSACATLRCKRWAGPTCRRSRNGCGQSRTTPWCVRMAGRASCAWRCICATARCTASRSTMPREIPRTP